MGYMDYGGRWCIQKLLNFWIFECVSSVQTFLNFWMFELYSKIFEYVWTLFKQFLNGLNTVSLNVWMGTGHLMLALSSGKLACGQLPFIMGNSIFFVYLSCHSLVVRSKLIQKFKHIQYFLNYSKMHTFKHFWIVFKHSNIFWTMFKNMIYSFVFEYIQKFKNIQSGLLTPPSIILCN